MKNHSALLYRPLPVPRFSSTWTARWQRFLLIMECLYWQPVLLAVCVLFYLLSTGCVSDGLSYPPKNQGGSFTDIESVSTKPDGTVTATHTRTVQQGDNPDSPTILKTDPLPEPAAASRPVLPAASGNSTATAPFYVASLSQFFPAQGFTLTMGTGKTPVGTLAPPPDYTRYWLIGLGTLMILVGVFAAPLAVYAPPLAPFLTACGSRLTIYGIAFVAVGTFEKQLEGWVWIIGGAVALLCVVTLVEKFASHQSATRHAKATPPAGSTTTAVSMTTSTPGPTPPAGPITVGVLSAEATIALGKMENLVTRMEALQQPPITAGATQPPQAPPNPV